MKRPGPFGCGSSRPSRKTIAALVLARDLDRRDQRTSTITKTMTTSDDEGDGHGSILCRRRERRSGRVTSTRGRRPRVASTPRARAVVRRARRARARRGRRRDRLRAHDSPCSPTISLRARPAPALRRTCDRLRAARAPRSRRSTRSTRHDERHRDVVRRRRALWKSIDERRPPIATERRRAVSAPWLGNVRSSTSRATPSSTSSEPGPALTGSTESPNSAEHEADRAERARERSPGFNISKPSPAMPARRAAR